MPRTMPFLQQMKHQEAYKTLKGKEGPRVDTVFEALENVTDLGGTELEEPSEDEDIDGPSILLDQETNAEAEVDLVAEVNKVFDSWMNFSPKFNDFLIEGATPIVTNRITGK